MLRLADLHLAELGATVELFARVRGVRRGQTKGGDPFLDLTLQDRSGSIAAKAWVRATRVLAAFDEGVLVVGSHVQVRAVLDSYQGALQLSLQDLRLASSETEGYDAHDLMPDGYELVVDLPIAHAKTLIFDLETVPSAGLAVAPASVRETVVRAAERHGGDQSKACSLSPFLGQVIALSVADADTDDEPTTFAVPNLLPDFGLRGRVKLVDEKDLLRAFWCIASQAECVVGFNSRGFDVPFLVGRSVVHGVAASVDLMGNRYSMRPHLDLWALLSGGRAGATLDAVAWACGLPSPKQELSGAGVAEAYARGELSKIAACCSRDVETTRAVYQRVRDNVLRFRSDW